MSTTAFDRIARAEADAAGLRDHVACERADASARDALIRNHAHRLHAALMLLADNPQSASAQRYARGILNDLKVQQ